MSQQQGIDATPRQFLGQPRGILLIFTTEVWERFSYFGMRGLLVLFLTAATVDRGFGWSPASALRLYATYTALVYLAPVIGGFIGDCILGRRRAVLAGALLMMLGHTVMALPGVVPDVLAWWSGYPVPDLLYNSGIPLGQFAVPDAAREAWSGLAAVQGLVEPPLAVMELAYRVTGWSFYVALTLIVAGTGFFKSNMAVMVGDLYAPDDSRRDAGFTIYYTGANLGAFAANLVAGTVGELWGWHWGFSIAGLGMAVGAALFWLRAPVLLAGVGDPPVRPTARIGALPTLAAGDGKRVLGILLMSAFTIVFWMGFEQGGGLLNIMVRDAVDRDVSGMQIPATWFQSLNPLFIFLLAPLFVMMWDHFQRRGYAPHPTQKYAAGLLIMGLSFVLLLGAQAEINATGQCSAWWLVTVFAVQTVGELAISPVSKSLVSRYAPQQVASPLMGAEFACYAGGAWLAGMLGAWAVATTPEQVFGLLLIVTVVAALACLAVRPLVDRLLGIPD